MKNRFLLLALLLLLTCSCARPVPTNPARNGTTNGEIPTAAETGIAGDAAAAARTVTAAKVIAEAETITAVQPGSGVAAEVDEVTPTDGAARIEEEQTSEAVKDTDKASAAAGDLFEKPLRLTVDGQPIAVDSPGYACPTMADVDGDGQEDLVVGQFASGSMKFYRNLAASDEPPRFAKADWIKTGGKRAVVPGVW